MSHPQLKRRALIQALSAALGSVSLGACGSGGGSGGASNSGSGLTGSSGAATGSSSSPGPSTGSSSSSGGASASTGSNWVAENPYNALRFTANATGSLPVMAATALPKGAYPSNVTPVTSSSGVHVIVKRRWNDGSAKHVILAGLLDLVSGTPKDVSLTTGSPASGVLTEAAIVAANPQASISAAGIGIGTVNLSSLLGSPVRTWVATPNMVECHYLAKPVANVFVWFHVRYWSGGHVWVRVVVEYSKLPYTSNTKLTYIPSVSLGGQVVWNNGGANYTHALETRWSVEGWVSGGADITVRHDPLALKATKLVPNFFQNNPTNAQLAALKTSYTPGSLVDLRANYEGTGYSPQIGLLPLWDVHYLTTGDPRAWRAVQANSLAAGTQATIWRDPNTNRAVRPSDWPTWSYSGSGGGGHTVISAASQITSPSPVTYTWDTAHNASSGYTAYLITGDYIHLETMHMQAASIYLGNSASDGSGVNRIVYGQTRAVGWFFRTVSQLAGIAPDGDTVASDMGAWLAANAAHHKSVGADAYPNGIGYPMTISTYDPLKPLSIAPWMHQFWIQSMGHGSDLEPLADMTGFNALRDWMYRGIVGMLGDGKNGSFDYRYAGMYNITVSSVIRPNFVLTLPNQLYQSWNDVWTASYAAILPNILLGKMPAQNVAPANTLVEPFWGGFYDWGYFKNLLPSIAYAVDHGASGAEQAWARLRGATNWQTLANSTATQPMWAVEPRIAVGGQLQPQVLATGSMPAWRQGMAARTWIAVPASNTLAAIDPANNPAINPNYPNAAPWRGTGGQSQIIAPWCGAVLDESTDSFYLPIAGGHSDYGGNEPYRIRLDQEAPAWQMLRKPSGAIGNTVPLAPHDGNDYYPDGRPRAIHNWNNLVYVPGRGPVVPVHGGGYPSAGVAGDRRSWQMNESTGEWAVLATHAGLYTSSSGSAACYDANRDCIWWRAAGTGRMRKLDLAANASTWVEVGNSATLYGWYVGLTYIPGHDVITLNGGSQENAVWSSECFKVFDPATGTHYIPTQVGTPPAWLDAGGYARPCWVPSLGALCFWNNSSNTATIVTLKPTGNPRTGPWEWGTLSVSSSNTVTPTARQQYGTYGRFVYSPRLNGFYLLNKTTDPVYFFALG